MSRWNPLTPEERFWSKVRITETCWLWTAAKCQNGYGNFVVKASRPTRNIGAHRFSYSFFNGKIPEGLELDHTCKNPACVNPRHLDPVTHKENLLRGATTLPSINAKKTECYRGHPLSGLNLSTVIQRGKAVRKCRECCKIRNHKCYVNRKSKENSNSSLQ